MLKANVAALLRAVTLVGHVLKSAYPNTGRRYTLNGDDDDQRDRSRHRGSHYRRRRGGWWQDDAWHIANDHDDRCRRQFHDRQPSMGSRTRTMAAE